MTNPTQSPLVLPEHGSTIIFIDRDLVGMGLLKNGVPYRVTHKRRGDLRFTWEGGRSVDWHAFSMRTATWTAVPA